MLHRRFGGVLRDDVNEQVCEAAAGQRAVSPRIPGVSNKTSLVDHLSKVISSENQ